MVEVLLLLAVAAFLAGLAGSDLGIGGGIFLIPFMTLALQIDIKVAIATSLIGVIATSSGAASVYVRDHLTNLRLAMFFFSSRRRHTIFDCDWSSDVCSSD